MKIVEKILFIISFIVAFIGIIRVAIPLVNTVLIIAGIIYLLAGWYLLMPVKGKVNRWPPFIVSYLIAQTLAVLLFGINIWPIFETFAIFNFIVQLVAFIIFYIKRKTLAGIYPVNKYLVRLGVCLIFSLTPGYMHIFVA